MIVLKHATGFLLHFVVAAWTVFRRTPAGSGGGARPTGGASVAGARLFARDTCTRPGASICPASPHRIATYSGRNILREGRCSARRMRRRRRADGRRLPPPGDRGHDRSIPAGDQEPASARRMLVSDINLKRCDRDGKHVPRRYAYDQANFPACCNGRRAIQVSAAQGHRFGAPASPGMPG